MKRLNILSMLVAAVLSVPMLTGCSDDDVIVKTPLGDPELSSDGETVSTLDFSWDKVDGATQYGYELTDPAGEVVAADVTTSTSAHFTKLAEKTTYTLTVRAFANVNSDMTTSKVITLTATTAARIAVDTPSGLAYTVTDDGDVVISWTAVEHASRYYYTYTVNGIEIHDSTSKTKTTINGLPAGDYTFTIYADSKEEAYKKSETAQLSFTRPRIEVSRITGEYHSALLDQTWSADLVSYDDGSYVIEKWYGVDGYDLEFSVNDDGSLDILNYTKVNSGWYSVPSGTSLGDMEIYVGDGYSGYKKDGDWSVWLYVYSSSNGAEGTDSYATIKLPIVISESVNYNVIAVDYSVEATIKGGAFKRTGIDEYCFEDFMGSGIDLYFILGNKGEGYYDYSANSYAINPKSNFVTVVDDASNSWTLRNDAGDADLSWTPAGTDWKIDKATFWGYGDFNYTYVSLDIRTGCLYGDFIVGGKLDSRYVTLEW